MMPIRLVAFDVGEVLIDETRMWGQWADALGVTRLTFAAALGAVIVGRRHHREAFAVLGIPLAEVRKRRPPYSFEASDRYPDALPCLARLRAGGYRTAIVANQPRPRMAELPPLGIDAELMASSQEWGVEKPAAGFFARLIAEAGVPAAEIAYVGDRIDNDVIPARRAGIIGVFLRRGPWGAIQATWPEAAEADLQIVSLDELPDAFSRL